MTMIWLAMLGMAVKIGLDVVRYTNLRALRRAGGTPRAPQTMGSRERQEQLLHPRRTRPAAPSVVA